jgi:hypothetical protein
VRSGEAETRAAARAKLNRGTTNEEDLRESRGQGDDYVVVVQVDAEAEVEVEEAIDLERRSRRSFRMSALLFRGVDWLRTTSSSLTIHSQGARPVLVSTDDAGLAQRRHPAPYGAPSTDLDFKTQDSAC